MKKLLTLALALMLALACLAPAAVAESYTIGGVGVNVPDGMEASRENAMTITVWCDDGSGIQISSFSMEEAGIDSALLDSFGEEMLLEVLGEGIMAEVGISGETEYISGRCCHYGIGEVDAGYTMITMLVGLTLFEDNFVIFMIHGEEAGLEAWLTEAIGWIGTPAKQSDLGLLEDKLGNVRIQKDGTWYLPGYGVRVTLTDADCNILTVTMSEKSPSLSRLGISWKTAVAQVNSGGADMTFVPLDARDFPNFVVDFSVTEDGSLGDISLKGMKPMGLEACMLALVPEGVEYEVFETDTAVFCVYDWNIGNVDTRTYVTIHQGNIYEFEMRRLYSPITADDIAFAEMVVRATEFE